MFTFIRRLTQVSTIVIFMLISYLNQRDITFVNGSLIALKIGAIEITDPFSVLQYILINRTNILLSYILSALIPIVVALCFGRVFCSFICPANTIFELAGFFTKNIKRVFNLTPSAYFRYIFLFVLSAVVFFTALPLGNLISLPGIITLEFNILFKEMKYSNFWIFFLLIIFFEILFQKRLWCNFLCPQGSFIAIFRTPKTLKVYYDNEVSSYCGGCKRCIKKCPLNLNPIQGKATLQCTNCGECVIECRKNNKDFQPLKFRF